MVQQQQVLKEIRDKKENKGDTGNAGSAGATGDKGQKGDTGNAGSAGATGDKGQKGEGAKGDTGNAGSAGATGDKGQKGDTGNAGSAVMQGKETGDKGQKGDTGNAGSAGATGDKGQKGDTGNAGSAGATGDKGQKGEGAKGEKGEGASSSGNGFDITGSFPNKKATAPTDINEYIFTSGGGGNGDCKLVLSTNTDDAASVYPNIEFQHGFGGSIKSSIGLGSSTSANDMILNTNAGTQLIRLQIASTDKLVVTNSEIQTTNQIVASGGNGEGVTIHGNSTGNSNYSYISFKDLNGTNRYGYCGVGSPGDQSIYIVGEKDDIKIHVMFLVEK